MKVEKADAVAICQDYGIATADGWDDAKLHKKLGEMLKLFRSGEFDWASKELLPIVEGLAEAEEFELVDEIEGEDKDVEKKEEEDDDDWDRVLEKIEDEEEEESKEDPQAEGDPEKCPLQGGERVLVHDPDETWKGIVDRPITDRRVYVKDRKGEEFEVAIEKCEVAGVGPKPKPPKDEDDDDKTIRELKEKLAKAKGGKKKGVRKGKKLNREQMFLKVMKERERPGTIEEIGEELDGEYADQGRTSNLKSSVSMSKRLLKAGVLFGVIEQRGDKFRWTIE